MELPPDVRDALKRPDNLKPYSEKEATVDALAGRQACRHGVWPHQGNCAKCASSVIEFSFGGLFSRDVQ
jgi:hypothetical protein